MEKFDPKPHIAAGTLNPPIEETPCTARIVTGELSPYKTFRDVSIAKIAIEINSAYYLQPNDDGDVMVEADSATLYALREHLDAVGMYSLTSNGSTCAIVRHCVGGWLVFPTDKPKRPPLPGKYTDDAVRCILESGEDKRYSIRIDNEVIGIRDVDTAEQFVESVVCNPALGHRFIGRVHMYKKKIIAVFYAGEGTPLVQARHLYPGTSTEFLCDGLEEASLLQQRLEDGLRDQFFLGKHVFRRSSPATSFEETLHVTLVAV